MTDFYRPLPVWFSVRSCGVHQIAVYTIIGSDEELPLGEEFQGLVRCFVNSQEKKPDKKYLPAAKLLEQLA